MCVCVCVCVCVCGSDREYVTERSVCALNIEAKSNLINRSQTTNNTTPGDGRY